MDTAPADPESVARMWAKFKVATSTEAELVGAFAFGDSAEMADELADLVLNGTKRATAGLLAAYVADKEPLPREGDYAVVLDGRGAPVAVIRDVQVEVKPLSSVDAAFAWDEGEGDRSLEWWLEAHRGYFQRDCEQRGAQFSEDVPTVFERFEVVWPTGLAG